MTRGTTSTKRTLDMTGIVAIGLTANGTPAEEFPRQAMCISSAFRALIRLYLIANIANDQGFAIRGPAFFTVKAR